MKILPAAQREAMFEIYGFCRRVDDIADSQGPRAERLLELARWRADVNALYEGKSAPRIASLAEPIRRFDLAREDFLALIDGMEMDAFDDIRGPTWATLDLYCDRVASAVGRLSVRMASPVMQARSAVVAAGRPRSSTLAPAALSSSSGI